MLGDILLSLILKKPQLDKQSFSLIEVLHGFFKEIPVIDPFKGFIILPHSLVKLQVILLKYSLIKGLDVIHIPGFNDLQNCFLFHLKILCNLVYPGRPLMLLHKIFTSLVHLLIDLIYTPGYAYYRGLIPKISLNFTNDGWSGKADKLHLSIRIKAFYGINKGYTGNLIDIITFNTPVGEFFGNDICKIHILGDYLIPDGKIAIPAVGLKQFFLCALPVFSSFWFFA